MQDEDFIAEKDDAGSPTDDSEEEGSDGSEDGDGEVSSTNFFWLFSSFSSFVIAYIL